MADKRSHISPFPPTTHIKDFGLVDSRKTCSVQIGKENSWEDMRAVFKCLKLSHVEEKLESFCMVPHSQNTAKAKE
jgi:hypothetical protein